MKKLLLILSVILSSCSCLLSQIPPQTIYVDQNCEALLPDYTIQTVAIDNCPEGMVINQTPIPGTLMSVSNPALDVSIKAVDAFGNTSNTLTFTVILLDTIAPVLSWPIAQINMTDEHLIALYQNWEAGVKVKGIANWIYDQSWTQGMAFADTTRIIESLKTFTHVITLTDEEYSQYESYKNSIIN